MLSISAKTRYGLVAIFELAKHYGTGVLQIKNIAEETNIPKYYLEQIFNRLVHHGIIKSVRGNKGGYQLADAPGNITLFQVLEVLEGGVDISSKLQVQALANVFYNVEQDIKKRLTVTLEDIVFEQQKLEQEINFCI